MTHHVSQPSCNSEEVSLLSSACTARSGFDDEKSDVSSIQQFFLAEERREQVAEATKNSNVRAIKKKFEQASLSKGGVPKKKVSCGSPLAERVRQLQQSSMFFPKDDASSLGEGSSLFSVKDEAKDKISPFRKKKGKATNGTKKGGRASKVADRKRLFERAAARFSELSREEAAASAASRSALASEPDSTLAMTISDSEFSALDYDGSLFSDDTLGRDEASSSRRPQASEKREAGDSSAEQQMSNAGPQVGSYTTTLSPNNSFQEALHEIVQGFQEETTCRESPMNQSSPHESVKEEKGERGVPKSNQQPVFYMETNRRDDPSPVSMLTGFETEADDHTDQGSAASKGSLSVASGGVLTPGAFSALARKSNSPPIPVKKPTRDVSPNEELPNSSLFSTVDQEEERERSGREDAASEAVPFDETSDIFEEARETIEPEEPPVVQPAQPGGNAESANAGWAADSRVTPGFQVQPPSAAAAFIAQRESEAEEEFFPHQFTDFADFVNFASFPEEYGIISEAHSAPEANDAPSSKNELSAHKLFGEPALASAPAAATNAAAHGSPARFEFPAESKQDKDQPVIKGILKNRLEEPVFIPAASLANRASPTASSASWYSSAATSAASEVSSHLSPLQNPRLAIQNNRFSIGACVNAHLAENPPYAQSEVSSQASSQHQHERRRRSSSRAERRDSVSSSVISRLNDAASPCSMEPQFSSSQNQDHQQDLHELASAMTTMANTASTVVLDVLVEAADKVVVSPLLSLFNCVDQSESFLCAGSPDQCWSIDRNKRRGAKSKKHHRHHSHGGTTRTRKFKA